ncbi:MAG: hypothetical protein QXQ79_01630 [Candidatus Nanoarchaeia archaeon]
MQTNPDKIMKCVEKICNLYQNLRNLNVIVKNNLNEYENLENLIKTYTLLQVAKSLKERDVDAALNKFFEVAEAANKLEDACFKKIF